MKDKYIPIAIISCVMLVLELTFTRILSFIYWNHLVYLIISIVLLGYGIGSMFIIIARKRLERYEFGLVQGYLLLCFSLSVPLSLIIVSRVLIPLHGRDINLLSLSLPLLLNYFFFILPFVFLGAFLVNYFFKWPRKSGLLYLFDLVGAAAGCVIFPLVLKKVGAINLSLFMASTGFAVALFIIIRSSVKLRRFSVIFTAATFLVLVSVWILGSDFIQVRPVSTKILARAYSHPGAVIEHTRWGLGGRVDVAGADDSSAITGKDFPIPNLPHKVITIDGDAYTAIIDRNYFSLNTPCEKIFRFLQSSPYTLYPPRKVLIIGTGGGPDIIKALACKSEEITGVEVAGATIDAMKGAFAEYSGGIYLHPNVNVFHDEGRSFLKRSDEKYNVIQMSGVDTFSALASGAYVLAENYLYTVDAMKDYLDHLEDNGFLIIRRWYFGNTPRETLRLFVLTFHALEEMGVTDPGKHIIISGKLIYANTTIKRTSFTGEELEAFELENSRVPELETIFRPQENYCEHKDKNYFYAYACAYQNKKEKEFIDDYFYDISPVYDNNPFFFNYYKLKNYFKTQSQNREWRTGYWAYLILAFIFIQSALLIIIFIILPLFLFKKEGLKLSGSLYLILYFTCLGLGFIIIEIALMQRLTLFLGLPIYSIAVVLSSLLLSAGLGSFISGIVRIDPQKLLIRTTLLLIPVLIITNYSMPVIIQNFLGASLAVRIALTVATIFPLGILMGIYFPTGLVISSRASEYFVPWAWGINAGFTVIGSIFAIIAAMVIGFKGILWLAMIFYIIALLSIRIFLKNNAR